MSVVILISGEELSKQSILGGNIDKDKLYPAVKAFQQTKLKPLLGKALYDKISDDYFNDTLAGDYLEAYNDYIKDMIIYGSAAIYIGSGGAYQVSNVGIVKANTDNSQALTKNEIDYLYQFNLQLYENLKKEFLAWLKTKNIPEYTDTCNSANQNKLMSGWYLRKRKRCDE